MTYKMTIVLLLFSVVACTTNSKQQLSDEDQNDVFEVADTITQDELDFAAYTMEKGRLGEIKVGTKIASLQGTLNQFEVQQIEAYDFGFDGGGEAFLYSYQNEPVFALIPAYETDSIIAIIGLHQKLQTSSGIHVNMSVKEIMKVYPHCKVDLNFMTDWEEIYDRQNDFLFVFVTDEKNRIGKYTEIGKLSKPLNLHPTLSWITLF